MRTCSNPGIGSSQAYDDSNLRKYFFVRFQARIEVDRWFSRILKKTILFAFRVEKYTRFPWNFYWKKCWEHFWTLDILTNLFSETLKHLGIFTFEDCSSNSIQSQYLLQILRTFSTNSIFFSDRKVSIWNKTVIFDDVFIFRNDPCFKQQVKSFKSPSTFLIPVLNLKRFRI